MEEKAECFECELSVSRKRRVHPRGGFARAVMFVGEAPGEQEEKQGKAFVGPSGKLLDKWIERLDLTERDVYITNVVKCRPPNNRDPTKDEIACCLPHLAREIQELHPLLVIPLGRFAKDVISHLRDSGVVSDSQYGLALRHPAWYLRQGGMGHVPSDELRFLKSKLDILSRKSNSPDGKEEERDEEKGKEESCLPRWKD